MSARDLDERATDAIARIKKQPGDVYVQTPFPGTQRAPMLPDEAGALCVVEHVFGGRSAIYAIEGNREQRRLVDLPDSDKKLCEVCAQPFTPPTSRPLWGRCLKHTMEPPEAMKAALGRASQAKKWGKRHG